MTQRKSGAIALYDVLTIFSELALLQRANARHVPQSIPLILVKGLETRRRGMTQKQVRSD